MNPPLVSDNAANMVVAGQELKSKPHVGCFAHTLNLAAQKSLKINAVSRLLGRVRKIVAYFHRSTTAAALLKSKIQLLGLQNLKLMNDVPTRWNSAADMLERYLRLQPAIYATLVTKNLNTDVTTLNETDTRQAKDIMECLVPLRDMTNAICTEQTPTVSIILPLMQKIKKIMAVKETDSPIIIQIKEAVTNNLSTRYASEEIQHFLEECTVLDPRFKDNYFEPDQPYAIYHRLTVLCSVGNIEVTVEPGNPTIMTPEPEPELPQLPVAMDVDHTAIPNENSQSEPLHKKVEVSEPVQKKHGGLSAIFDDVAIIKVEKGTRTPLERANDEINRYKEEPQISVKEQPLLWWKGHAVYFPLMTNVVRERLCIQALLFHQNEFSPQPVIL